MAIMAIVATCEITENVGNNQHDRLGVCSKEQTPEFENFQLGKMQECSVTTKRM
jgi:hypothetical protein